MELNQPTAAQNPDRLFSNALVLSNILELTSLVFINLSPKEVGDSISENHVNRSQLCNVAINCIKKHLQMR